MADAGRNPNAGREAGGDASAYAAMLARAEALIPKLSERASRTEELRRLPPETERELHESGLFRVVQPKRVGGSEFDYVALVDCADVLGQGDASVAWNFANLASHANLDIAVDMVVFAGEPLPAAVLDPALVVVTPPACT